MPICASSSRRLGEADAVAPPQAQRRLAIAGRGAAQLVDLAQLAVVVDLAIGDERGRAGEERLVAGDEVDDGEAGMGERDAARDMVPGAVGAAMRHGRGHVVQLGRVDGRGGGREVQDAADAAHDGSSRPRS